MGKGRKNRNWQKETKHQDHPMCKHTEVIICLNSNTRMQHICHGIFTIVECLPVAESLNVNCAQVVSSSSPSHAPYICVHAPIDTQQNVSLMLAQYYTAASDWPQSNSTAGYSLLCNVQCNRTLLSEFHPHSTR